jgi:hypothetical protein
MTIYVKGDQATAERCAKERGIDATFDPPDRWGACRGYADSKDEEAIVKWFAQADFFVEGTNGTRAGYQDGTLLHYCFHDRCEIVRT